MTQMYYKGADAAILVYDVTIQDTVDRVRHTCKHSIFTSLLPLCPSGLVAGSLAVGSCACRKSQPSFLKLSPNFFASVLGLFPTLQKKNISASKNVHLNSVQIKKWQMELNEFGDNKGIKVYVVGNKCDLNNQRIESNDRGLAFANQNSCYHVFASAKSGLGVAELFQQIA